MIATIQEPPGDNYNRQEVSRKEQKLHVSLQELLVTIKKLGKTGLVLATKLFGLLVGGASWGASMTFVH